MSKTDESPRSSDDRFYTPRVSARTAGYASSDNDEGKFATPRDRLPSDRSQASNGGQSASESDGGQLNEFTTPRELSYSSSSDHEREEFYSSREDPYAAADVAVMPMPFIAGGSAPHVAAAAAMPEAARRAAAIAHSSGVAVAGAKSSAVSYSASVSSGTGADVGSGGGVDPTGGGNGAYYDSASSGAAPTGGGYDYAPGYGQAQAYAATGGGTTSSMSTSVSADYYGGPDAASGAAKSAYTIGYDVSAASSSYDYAAPAADYDAAAGLGAGAHTAAADEAPAGSYYDYSAGASSEAAATAASDNAEYPGPGAYGDKATEYPRTRVGATSAPPKRRSSGASRGSEGSDAKSSARSFTDGDVADIFSLARHNKCKEVTALLERGVPVNIRDKFGNTILTVACQNGLKRMAKVALRAGADINTKNYKGNTPLHFCFTFGFDELGQYLLGKGASGEVLNNAGLTCFQGLERADADE